MIAPCGDGETIEATGFAVLAMPLGKGSPGLEQPELRVREEGMSRAAIAEAERECLDAVGKVEGEAGLPPTERAGADKVAEVEPWLAGRVSRRQFDASPGAEQVVAHRLDREHIAAGREATGGEWQGCGPGGQRAQPHGMAALGFWCLGQLVGGAAVVRGHERHAPVDP